MIKQLIIIGLTFSMCSSSEIENPINSVKEHLNQRISYGYNSFIAIGTIDTKGYSHYFYQTDQSKKLHPSPQEAIFEIGSLTKLFTAHLILILESEEKFSLNDPIDQFVSYPIPSYNGEKITIFQLLTHTSGLSDPTISNYYDPISKNTEPAADFEKDDLKEYLRNFVLSNTPGTTVNYSNIGYALLGEIIESVSGKCYFELLKQKILDPLQMDHTYLKIPKTSTHTLVLGSNNGITMPYWHIKAFPAFGGLLSTMEDLTRYLRYLFIDTKTEQENQIITKLLLPVQSFAKDLWVTPGLTIDKRHNGNFFAGTGKTLGTSSFLGFSSEKNQGIIVLTDSTSQGDLGHHLLNSEFSLPKLHPPSPFQDSYNQLRGKYQGINDFQDMEFTIFKEENHLILHSSEELPLPLYPTSNYCFFSKNLSSDDQIKFTIRDDPQKRVTLSIMHNNQEIEIGIKSE